MSLRIESKPSISLTRLRPSGVSSKIQANSSANEPNNANPGNYSECPLGEIERRSQSVGNFNNDPRERHIGDTYAIDVMALEFLEERHVCYLGAMLASNNTPNMGIRC